MMHISSVQIEKTVSSRFFQLALSVVLLAGSIRAQTVNVDASMSNQTFEGWGTSLAWFANGVGGWTNSTNYNNLMNALFNPASGLGLNYLRYNIGGGDDPKCNPNPPTIASTTQSGTVPSGTYYDVVTSIDSNGNETLVSTAEMNTTLGAQGTITASAGVSGASSYRLYLGTASGQENTYFTSTTGSFTVSSYNGSNGTPPAITAIHYGCIVSPHNDPGYEPSSGTYDWTKDANQRTVATKAQSLGANLFEAISYSPPYWMTVSGTSEGGVNGADNVAAAYYGSGSGTFADYLASVSEHFSSSFGITFHHLDPMNEPGADVPNPDGSRGLSYWIAGSTKQEGCGVASLSSQETLIQNTHDAIAAKSGLLTRVAAMDETDEGDTNNLINGFPFASTAQQFYNYDSTTVSDIDQLNTHGYESDSGSSVALYTAALHAGKRLVISEWGSNDNTGKDLSNQILTDIYLTRPVAWVIWQPDWPELVNIDYLNQAYTLNESYYVFEQYAKFIRPGFQFLAISDPQSLAAFNQQTKTLVIVTQNWTGSGRTVTYQLSNFTSLGANAAVYRTSSTENFASRGNVAISNGSWSYTANANSVTTFVIQNISYTPSATTVNDKTAGTGLNQFSYHGTWSYYNSQNGAYDSDNHWSSTTGDYFTFEFSGQQARVYASMAPNGGILVFSVDNGTETYFDTYAAMRVDNVFLVATPTLGNGVHTLKVRVTGLKNAASSGYIVPADRIDVVGSGSEVGQGIYKIVNVRNGLDLEVNSASLADGGTVDTYADVSGANNEHWNLMAVGDGSYRIVNVNSGLDLEVYGASKSGGATVDQWQESGAAATNEHWNLIPVTGGYRIVNVNSGLDLEVNGTTGKVDQWQDVSGATNEHWTLSLTN